jgi:hypothetical protein
VEVRVRSGKLAWVRQPVEMENGMENGMGWDGYDGMGWDGMGRKHIKRDMRDGRA